METHGNGMGDTKSNHNSFKTGHQGGSQGGSTSIAKPNPTQNESVAPLDLDKDMENVCKPSV